MITKPIELRSVFLRHKEAARKAYPTTEAAKENVKDDPSRVMITTYQLHTAANKQAKITTVRLKNLLPLMLEAPAVKKIAAHKCNNKELK